MDIKEVMDFLGYVNILGDRYKSHIEETDDFLCELSNRITIKNDEAIKTIQKNFPIYSNLIRGFADMYSTRLFAVKKILISQDSTIEEQ